MSVHKYSVTPDSNTSVGDGSDAVGLQEGMPRQNVNNAMRAIASDIAKNYKDHGSLVTAGTGTAYTVFAQSDFTTYFVGLSLVVKLHADCGANATINVNGRGAKQLRMRGPNGVTNIEANALRANEVVHIIYNGTQFHVLGAFDYASIHSRISTLETQATTGTVNNSDQLDGQHGSFYQNADNINAGTIAPLHLYSNRSWETETNGGWFSSENAPAGTDISSYVDAIHFGHNGGIDYFRALNVRHAENQNLYYSHSTNGGTWTHSKLWSDANDGAGSGLDADLLDGQQGEFYRNASNLNTGTVPTARLSGSYNISISGTSENSNQLGGYSPSHFLAWGNVTGKPSPTLTLTGDASGSATFSNLGSVSLNVSVLDNSHNHSNYLVRNSSLEGNLDTKFDADMFGFSPSTTGRPESYGQGLSIVSSGNTHDNSNNWITQLAFGTNVSSGYFRTKVNAGSWGAWNKLWHNNNDGAGSGLDADLLDGVQGSNYARVEYNGVGSYIFANNNSGGIVLPNSTVAGSSLRPTGAYTESADAYALSGTWRCMGYKYGGNTSFNGEAESTLWVRIA